MTSLIPGNSQMEATAAALQATQIALDVQVAQIEQQQTAIAQQPTAAEAEAHSAPVEGNEIIFEASASFTRDPSLLVLIRPTSRKWKIWSE